jgi:DNA repair exonuclease SbcCD ATPase subunit
MIKSLDIFNFQSHKHSTLHFHSGLNVIVGPTDSGKSVILRTLRKLFFNRPFGSAFRSTWGGETYIETLTDDDTLIGLKEDSEKTYFLNDLEFKAFGQSIPKEIADNLNVNEVNIQQQLDSPFLFSQSPGEVAQHFNKIAHLEQITLSISNLKKWVTQLESTIKHKQEDLSKKIDELKTFDYLEKFEIELEVLEDMEKKVSSKKSQKTQLSIIINKFNFVEDEIECYQDILLIEDNLILIIDKIQEVQQKKQKADDFSKLIYNIEGIELDIESEKNLISCEKDVGILIETLNKLSNIESDRDRLNKVVKNVNSVSDDLEYNKKLYNKLYAQFEKEMGGVCILCGTKLKK